jgi:tripartite-type tricarboxylate transporter receptor subunit TctC
MTVTPLRVVLAILAIVFALGGGGAGAEGPAYPERPITMVVTFAAGGSSDVLARAVADATSRGLGQQVVVDNRPGAGGQIGAEAVAHAAARLYVNFFQPSFKL